MRVIRKEVHIVYYKNQGNDMVIEKTYEDLNTALDYCIRKQYGSEVLGEGKDYFCKTIEVE